MDIVRIQKICEQLTKSLTPVRVEILEPTEKSFTLRVVSNQFENLTALARFELLSKLLENSPDLARTYLFDFEAWTEAEFATLEGSSSSHSSGNANSDNGIAARSPGIRNPLI